MRKTILMAMLPFMYFADGFAQTDKAVEDIVKVKGDTSYVYAEATMKSLDEAFVGAKSILEMKVAEWVKAQGISGVDVCIAKAKEHCFEIQTRRGEYYRAFVYVRKNDIMPVTDKKEIVVFDVSEKETAAPTATQNDVLSEGSTNDNKSSLKLTDDEKTIASIRTLDEYNAFVNYLNKEKKYINRGGRINLPKEGIFYIIIYDGNKQVIDNLKHDKNGMLDLRTLQPYKVKEYVKCGLYWLQIKQ